MGVGGYRSTHITHTLESHSLNSTGGRGTTLRQTLGAWIYSNSMLAALRERLAEGRIAKDHVTEKKKK